MAPVHSQPLTNMLLLGKEEEMKVPFSLGSQVMKLLREPDWIVPPVSVWVFWGEPYDQIFEGLGRCLRHQKTLPWNTGIGRPMRVYEGHKHSMGDFLSVEPDGGITFVHEAHRLRGPKSTAYFKGFKRFFEDRYPRNQIVFMSKGPFGKELPGMEHVKVIDGEVDCGWEWSADDPVTSVEVSMAHMHEAFNARIQARKEAALWAALRERSSEQRAAEVAAERAREASETVAPGLARAAAPPTGQGGSELRTFR